MFIMGIKLGAPTLVALFIVTVSLGFLAKSVPQMNVFMVGFPLKIFVGLVMLGLSTYIFTYMIKNAMIIFETKLDQILRII